jgi:outer membrane PBP1 activator LpoA protein
VALTVEDLRNRANEEAQRALRDMNDYQSKHGQRDRTLEDRYEAAERVVDALDELISLDRMLDRNAKVAHDAAWAAEALAPGVGFDVPLAVVPRTEDAGDHYAWPV